MNEQTLIQTPSETPCWIGWAGYLFRIPKQYRLARVQGDYWQGGLAIADEERVRIELRWTLAKRRTFDLKVHAQKRWGEPGERLGAAAMKELCILETSDDKPVRAIGYCEFTSRVVEIDFHGDQGKQELWQSLLSELIDQPRHRPMKWSYFDCSFIAPPEFIYADSTLNLGDMSVRLLTGGSEKGGSVLSVRQIYPAALALARQPLEEWLREWDRQASTYYVREGSGLMGRKPAVLRECTTLAGKGYSAKSRLGRKMHWLYWNMGRACEARMIEDPRVDRLIGVRVTDREEHVSPLIDEVLSQGLHWAKSDETKER